MSNPVRLSELNVQMADDSRTGSMVNLSETNKTSGASLLLTILVGFVGVLSLIALVIAAVSLARPNINLTSPAKDSQKGAAGAAKENVTKRLWTVHIGHNYGAHEYIDDKGYLQGFSKDMVLAVCRAAGVQCATIWDKYKNCWDSEPGDHSFGGPGLFGGWYDGCAGWYTTIERIHVFRFSQPYLTTPKAYFFVKKGDTSFNPTNIQNKKIGFIDGWASDEKCLARQSTITGNIMKKANVIHASDSGKLKDLVVKGEVVAAFSTKETMEKFVTSNELQLVGASQGYSCLMAGNALMARKDSPLVDIWNTGYNRLRASGEFAKLCAKGKQTHGIRGSIDCL